MTDAINITIPAAYIDAALCAVSKEETRYYLCGVFIDGRGFIASTNGHIAFAARCPAATAFAGVVPSYAPAGAAGGGIIVPHTAIAAVAKGKDDQYHITRDAQGLYWLARGAMRTHFTPIDGTYPDWQRVVPEQPAELTAAHYQPQYIKALGDMAKALRDGKKDSASLFHINQAGEGPALVTFPAPDATDGALRTDCCAVIMPMRTKGEGAFDSAAFLAS